MALETIRILVTGGTFDKEYNELTATLFPRRQRALLRSMPLGAG